MIPGSFERKVLLVILSPRLNYDYLHLHDLRKSHTGAVCKRNAELTEIGMSGGNHGILTGARRSEAENMKPPLFWLSLAARYGTLQ
jgi:hypothetical protein